MAAVALIGDGRERNDEIDEETNIRRVYVSLEDEHLIDNDKIIKVKIHKNGRVNVEQNDGSMISVEPRLLSNESVEEDDEVVVVESGNHVGTEGKLVLIDGEDTVIKLDNEMFVMEPFDSLYKIEESNNGKGSLPVQEHGDARPLQVLVFLGLEAFSECRNLQEIQVDEDLMVVSIGSRAFQDCESLVSFHLSSNLKFISEGTFQNCRALRTIVWGLKLESIGRSAFEGCSSLLEIHLPDSIRTICRQAFAGCSSVTRVHLPEWIKKIKYLEFGDEDTFRFDLDSMILHFSYFSTPDAWVNALCQIEIHLEEVNFNYCAVNLEGHAMLLNRLILQSKTLKKLVFTGCSIDPDMFQSCLSGSLDNCTGLVHFVIEGESLDEYLHNFLLDKLLSSEIYYFGWENFRWEGTTCRFSSSPKMRSWSSAFTMGRKRLSEMSELKFAGTLFTQVESLLFLKSSIRFTSLRTLIFDSCYWNLSVFADCLETLKSCNHLEGLEFRDDSFEGNENVADALLEAVHPLELNKLSLHRWPLQRKTPKIATIIRQATTLSHLTLSHCGIGNARSIFEATGKSACLEELSLLSNPAIAIDDWIDCLGDIKHLRTLHLPTSNWDSVGSGNGTVEQVLGAIQQNLSLFSLPSHIAHEEIDRYLRRNKDYDKVRSGMLDLAILPLWPVMLDKFVSGSMDKGTLCFTFLQQNISRLPDAIPNRRRQNPV